MPVATGDPLYAAAIDLFIGEDRHCCRLMARF